MERCDLLKINLIQQALLMLIALSACFLLAGVNAQGQRPGKTPSHKVGIDYSPNLSDTDKTKILILATPHLGVLQDCFEPLAIEPLLGVLESYKPDVIGVESVSPAVLEDMEKRGGYFNQIIEYFAKTRVDLGHKMQKLLNLSRVEAEARADALLRTKPTADPTIRLELIAFLVAAYDYDSAVLQWSYLPEARRQPSTALPVEISTQLDKALSSPNERIAVGVALARRLGLQRVVGIDDHFDEELLARMATQFSNEVGNSPEVKAVSGAKFYVDSAKQLKDACRSGHEMLSYYLNMNSPAYTSTDVAMQWGVWFRTRLPSRLDRSRVAQWEVRNLNIASRIREASVSYPGKRLLVIIGAGHKPFLDSYLSKMLDVKLVQLSDLVRKHSIKRKSASFNPLSEGKPKPGSSLRSLRFAARITTKGAGLV